jgi:signal transduction histidine kinase
MRLTTKFYALIMTVSIVTFVSSAISLYAIWQMAILNQDMITDNLPSKREAEMLNRSLLKQSDVEESYILDNGNRRWLDALALQKQNFQQWLATALTTTHSDEERDILTRLDKEYQELDRKRQEVFALFDMGDDAKAKKLLLEELDPISDRVNATCDKFLENVDEYIDSATARAESRTSRLMWIVCAFVGLTMLSGLGLMWLFTRDVHAPLRKMIADAQKFTDAGRSGADIPPEDEFSAVGFYLRALMSDVKSTRTALNRTRRQALNAEKLASVGKLAASVAHEIRNPLIAVRLFLTSIIKKSRDDPELSRDLGMISDEITRLDGIVCDFLEFSRPQVLNIEQLQIASLLDETLELVGHRCEESRIKLIRKYSAGLPPVMADAKQLKQIFINLLNNAVEAMPNGGEIRIIADAANDSDARPMLAVGVQDTGPGIPKDVQKRLFEPFFTTKENGTGLGLCIAAGIMTRHGGRLTLESSTNQGTTFTVWIPETNEKIEADAKLTTTSAT